MDPRGNIYESDDVPPEDKARLDGYLKARAEQDKEALLKERVEELEQQLREKDPGVSG